MRCFIAIDLPENVREEIVKIQKALEKEYKKEENGPKAKFVEKENLHLTLKFLGEITDAKIQKVKEKLKEIKLTPFKVSISNLGVFPSVSFIRVIWVGVEPDENVKLLQAEIDSKLEGLFKKEKHFEAHITLARVKFVKDKAKLVRKLQETKVEPVEFSIISFKLKKSTVTRQGPIYEDILEFR